MASAVDGGRGSKRNAGAGHSLGSRWKAPAGTPVMTSETWPGRERSTETPDRGKVSRCAERQSAGTPASVGQALGHAAPLAHRERPSCTQALVAKRRTHAAKRERPGREARAFTLYLLARQFRARLFK
jgi:hypothetical protein